MVDELMRRIKENYEVRQRHYLTRRTPVILRLDMSCGSSYTSPLKDRFHKGFIEVMNLTAIKLMEKIQGAQVAFTQSDEVSILLHDYKNLQSEAWFDYCQNKVESISASIAGATFTFESWRIWGNNPTSTALYTDLRPAYFDSRAFNIPEAEVNNYFIARQRDAVKNSINSLAQSLYSHKELQGKKSSELQEMCFQRGSNWDLLPTSIKRGRCIVKQTYEAEGATRSKWVVDDEIPTFTQDRDYIERYLIVNE